MRRVIIYTTPSCGWCRLTKEFLRGNSVKYLEIDVSRDHQAAHEMIMKSGQFGVPVLDIVGEIIVGFDRDGIEYILKSKGILKNKKNVTN